MNVDVNNIVISKLIETKNNSKYLTGYLDEVTRPLVLYYPKLVDLLNLLRTKMEIKIKIRLIN